jgi:hypothetical protein
MRTYGCILGVSVFVASAAGCSSEVVGDLAPDAGTDVSVPPPAGVGAIVTATSPAAGSWGTVYTIEGTHLDRGAQAVAFETTIGADVVVQRSSPFVVSWTSEKIEVKVPFPADGAVSVSGVAAGSFASAFAVGKKGLTHGGVDPTAILATGPGELVVASTRKVSGTTSEAFLYRMTATDAGDLPVTFARAALLRDASGPFAVLEDTALAHSLVSLAPGQVPAPVGDLPAARIVGSGTDATGAYVWTSSGSALTRHRRAAGAWSADRTVSGAYGAVRALAAADDGDLSLFTTTEGGGTFDDYDVVHAQHAGADDVTFGESATIIGDVDDSTFGYRVWARSGGASVVRFCATDERGVEFDGRACFYWSKAASGVPFTQADFVQLDGSGDGAATATCEDDVLVVTAGATKTKVLHPCRNVAGFTRDPEGKPALLVAHGAEYRFVFAKR